ncbi:MAG: 50S ribosomal protein L36 [Desulfobacteraceae bacterium]|nr:50S ribosomal protein L36 [Desulfobacteraceae bacterium]
MKIETAVKTFCNNCKILKLRISGLRPKSIHCLPAVNAVSGIF